MKEKKKKNFTTYKNFFDKKIESSTIFTTYKNFFDKKIESSTTVVAFICVILFLVGFFINNLGNISLQNNLQTNILNNSNNLSSSKNNFNNFETITINGKTYKLILIEN